MSKQAIFDLSEENTIEFKMSVKGSTNLPNVKPIIRFIVSENQANGFAIMLPAEATEEGVAVTIPPMKNILSEDKDYVGKLEIIIGNRYFSPAAMNLGFTNSINIEAEPVLKEHVPAYKVEAIKTTGEIKKENKQKDQVVVKEQYSKPEPEYDDSDLTDEVIASLEIKELPKPKVVTKQTQQAPTVVKEQMKKSQNPVRNSDHKEKLKNLIKNALK